MFPNTFHEMKRKQSKNLTNIVTSCKDFCNILKLTKHYFIFTGEVEAGGNNIQNRQRNTATLGLVVHAAG